MVKVFNCKSTTYHTNYILICQNIRTSKNKFAPLSKKRTIYISDFMQTTFFYLDRFMKKLADNQFSSITKGRIFYTCMKHNVYTTFNLSSGLTRKCVMEVFTMLYICRYCVFTWYGRISWLDFPNGNMWKSIA